MGDVYSEIETIFQRARALESSSPSFESTLAQLALEIAHLLLVQSRAIESDIEEQARRTLSGLLRSENNRLFSTALTDRAHRLSPQRLVQTLRDLMERTGEGKDFPHLDELQLRAARLLGELFPRITANAVVERLKKEAQPYLIDARDQPLESYLTTRKLSGVSVNLNYLGEEVLGKIEAQARVNTYCELVKRADTDAISVKLSGIDSQIDLIAFDATIQRLNERVRDIFLKGRKREGGPPLIYLDMEAYKDCRITEEVILFLLSSQELHDSQAGVAIQGYLPESTEMVRRLVAASGDHVQRGGSPLRIRLVKGANLEFEKVESSAHGHALPIFPEKNQVDAQFKRLLRELVAAAAEEKVHVGVASHNLFDISYALLLRARTSVPGNIQFEVLEGMGGALGEVLYRITGSLLIYCPIVLPKNFSSAVSYLVRRMDENTGENQFLRVAPFMQPGDENFLDQAAKFLKAHAHSLTPTEFSFRRQFRQEEEAPTIECLDLDSPFTNAPDTDWTLRENRQWLNSHLKKSQQGFARVHPLLAPSIPSTSRVVVDGFDPSIPGKPAYQIELANPQDVARALKESSRASEGWANRSVQDRALLLLKVASLLEKNRGPLLAAMLCDSAKRCDEADIEISEAVDFAHYYARNALRLAAQLPGKMRGTTVITPPWNFPLAIPLGGIFSALVTGNTCIIKPAPETPLVAFMAVQLCHSAGVPREALQFIPCHEEDAQELICNQSVKTVVLTGATSTAKVFLKMRSELFLLAETGGKNTAYVSPFADKEDAIAHIVKSAFGHSGQKCSALSLLILHDEVYQDTEFSSRLADAVVSLEVGSAHNLQSVITPLINPPSGALEKIINEGECHGTWLLQPRIDDQNPRLLHPGILWDVKPGTFPATSEFFGPILSVARASDLAHATELMNDSPYALTAGIFSLSEKEQEEFAVKVEAGNVYINRSITGAVVGRQPFGGRKESSFGIGGKAGGPDYLLQLMRPQQIYEDLDDDARFVARKRNYEEICSSYFTKVQEGTKIIGEENFFYYAEGRTALLICDGASILDVKTLLLARKLSRCEVPVFIEPHAHLKKYRELIRDSGAPSFVFSAYEVAEHAKKLGAERLRFGGSPHPLMIQEAHQAGLSTCLDPIWDSGRAELLHHFTSKSVSLCSHRHGNTSLGRLSSMRSVLQRIAQFGEK